MFVIICYDVNTETKAGRRRLRRVAECCSNYGQRMQYSVFECLVEPYQWETLKAELVDEIDPEKDSLCFYNLGKNWRRRVERHGRQRVRDIEGPLIL
jgi:CRISPR-associated protein Cas2